MAKKGSKAKARTKARTKARAKARTQMEDTLDGELEHNAMRMGSTEQLETASVMPDECGLAEYNTTTDEELVMHFVSEKSSESEAEEGQVAAHFDQKELTEKMAEVSLEANKAEKEEKEEKAEIDKKVASETEKAEREAEVKALQAQEAVILEQFAQDNFRPTSLPRGFFEKDEAYKARNDLAWPKQRLDFIAQNKEKALLDALRSAIRQNPSSMPEGENMLSQEEALQAHLSRFYGTRMDERRQEIEKVKKERSDARYYAKAPVAPTKHISNDVPGLNLSVGRHFGIQWQSVLARELQKPLLPKVLNAFELELRQKKSGENQSASAEASRINKNSTDSRVLGRVKREGGGIFSSDTVYEQFRPLFTPKPSKMKP